MRIFKSSALAMTLCFALSSCIFSLFPIYSEDDKVVLIDLFGEWELGQRHISFEPMDVNWIAVDVKIDGEPTQDDWVISQEGDTIKDKSLLEKAWSDSANLAALEVFGFNSMYIMTLTRPDSNVFKFQVAITEIAGQYFMDMYPYNDDEELTTTLESNFIPVHTFAKISVEDDQLIIDNFKMEEMLKLFQSNRIRLRHEKLEEYMKDYVLITAKTDELRKFIRNYAENSEVFESSEIYSRVTAP